MSVEVDVELDAQYRAMREQAGALVRAGRSFLTVTGADAAGYLQSQVTNDVEALEPGQGCYAALLDQRARMKGDMRVLRLTSGEFWLDTEEIAVPAIRSHLDIYRIGRSVELADASSQRVALSVLGPAAGEAAGARPGPEHRHSAAEVGGVPCRAVATDAGIDLLVPAADAGRALDAVLRAGAVVVSEAAAEIVRVESGRPRFGREMTTSTIPQEAGINGRAVSFTKGCYIGQETVARLHYKGRPNRHLRGLRLSRPVAEGVPLHLGEREVGRVGTACVSPRCGPIGLAIVRREAGPGDVVEVGDGEATAEVVDPPF